LRYDVRIPHMELNSRISVMVLDLV